MTHKSGWTGIAVFIGAFLFLVAPVWSEDMATPPVFISLTRTAETTEKLPTNISVITKDEIERSGAKTLDEVLDLAPGIDVSKTGTVGTFATLRMRGVPSSAHVQILIDDRPIGGVSAQFTDIAQIPIENIERIEIVRGGSSVLYGANTVGGVVNVITKRHPSDHALSSVGMDVRSFKTRIYRADLGMKGAGFDGYVNANRFFTDGFQQNSDADNFSASGNGGYSFSNGARLSIDLSRTDHETGDPQGTTVPLGQWDGTRERAAADTGQRIEKKDTAGRFQTSLPVGALGSVQSTFYGSRQDYLVFPMSGADVSFDQDNRVAGNDTRFLLPWGLTLGGAYERDQQRTLTSMTASHVTDWAVYAQESLSVGDLSLIPAVRLDQHSAFGNVVNPRLTTVYRLTEKWKVSANASRSFRAPSFLELYYQSSFFNGNPDLRPETAWTYDLGFQHRRPEFFDLDLSVTGFYTRIRDRITATMTTYENKPLAEQAGVEVVLSDKKGPLAENINYTYQRAVGTSLTSTRFVPLRLTPKHMANYQLVWKMPRAWSLSNTVQYVHKQYQSNDEKGVKLPSYTLWNARLSKKILAAELYVAVDNITNKHYAEAFGSDPVTFATTLYPQPGRTYWGGVTVRFLD